MRCATMSRRVLNGEAAVVHTLRRTLNMIASVAGGTFAVSLKQYDMPIKPELCATGS